MTKLLEKDIQKLIISYLRGEGYFAFPVKTTGTYDPRAKRFRANTTYRGIPDILCCFQLGASGLFVAFEVKTKTGKQSQHQKYFEKDCKAANGFYYVVRSVDDVKKAIEEIRSTRTTNTSVSAL